MIDVADCRASLHQAEEEGHQGFWKYNKRRMFNIPNKSRHTALRCVAYSSGGFQPLCTFRLTAARLFIRVQHGGKEQRVAADHHVKGGQRYQILLDIGSDIHQLQQGFQAVQEMLISVAIPEVEEEYLRSCMCFKNLTSIDETFSRRSSYFSPFFKKLFQSDAVTSSADVCATKINYEMKEVKLKCAQCV